MTPARSLRTTFSHSSACSPTFDRSALCNDRFAVLRRSLWQVTQYLSSSARCAVPSTFAPRAPARLAGVAAGAGCCPASRPADTTVNEARTTAIPQIPGRTIVINLRGNLGSFVDNPAGQAGSRTPPRHAEPPRRGRPRPRDSHEAAPASSRIMSIREANTPRPAAASLTYHPGLIQIIRVDRAGRARPSCAPPTIEEAPMTRAWPRLAVLLVSFAGPAPLLAQAVSTASIAGTVRDASGAVLPGVTITATHTDTGLTRSAVSDVTGGYTITTLPVGPYRLEFSLQGFRTAVQTGIVLQVNTNPTINATMELGRAHRNDSGRSGRQPHRDAQSGCRHRRGQRTRRRVAAQRAADAGPRLHDGYGRAERDVERRARWDGGRRIPRHDCGCRRAAERHVLRARRCDAQRSVQQRGDAASISRGPAGVQGRDQCPSGAVRLSLRGRR